VGEATRREEVLTLEEVVLTPQVVVLTQQGVVLIQKLALLVKRVPLVHPKQATKVAPLVLQLEERKLALPGPPLEAPELPLEPVSDSVLLVSPELQSALDCRRKSTTVRTALRCRSTQPAISTVLV
jgi:hypothetical protein